MIKVHDSIKSLHEDIDPQMLPEEYGGSAGKLSNRDAVKAVLNMEDYFQDLKKYIFQ